MSVRAGPKGTDTDPVVSALVAVVALALMVGLLVRAASAAMAGT